MSFGIYFPPDEDGQFTIPYQPSRAPIDDALDAAVKSPRPPAPLPASEIARLTTALQGIANAPRDACATTLRAIAWQALGALD